jgi:hypothetical protein
MLTPKTASKQMRNLFATPEPEPQPAAAPNKEGGRECIDDPNKDEPTKGTSLRPKQFERRIIAEIDLENVLPWHMEPDTANRFSPCNIEAATPRISVNTNLVPVNEPPR